MSERIKKLLFIFGATLLMGGFMQFSFISNDFSEPVETLKKRLPPFLDKNTSWCDSVFNTLTTEDRIGQMLMIPAYPNNGKEDQRRVASLIQKYHVGGIIFFQGTPEQVHKLTKYYQSISKVPLLIAIDGEWGLSMRLENTIKYPKQMTLGAITSDMLIYEMGQDIARQLKHLGIHVNFAPVVDINNNPKNPVINSRSFGEERENVARKALLYMKGMQDEGVLAFAKHFPGHGDTQTDSHVGLPVVNHSMQRLDSLELYPFRALINAGVGGVMMAHMSIPKLDSTPNLPSTLSPKIADTLLQQTLRFKGLVVTDAMNMGGVTDYFTPMEANLKAVLAGNDILLMPHDIEQSIKTILNQISVDSTIEAKINKSCRKILNAKEWVLDKAVKQEYSIDSIVKPQYIYKRDQLVEAAITVVKNEDDLLPLRSLDTLKIASITIGNSAYKDFVQTLRLYTKVDQYAISNASDTAYNNYILKKLKAYNLVILSIHSNSLSASKKFGFTNEEVQLAENIMAGYPTILVGLANPYVLSWFNHLDDNKVIVASYENSPEAQIYSAQMIFGATNATGKLPVSISSKYKAGTGINTYSLDRLKYVTAYEAGFDAKKLIVIDSIVQDAIDQKATPGCQIIAAKDGKVFFNKAYGYHTYSKKKLVNTSDLYDLASITKIAATVPSIIKLQSEKLIDINDRLGKYLPYMDTCAKGDLILSDILLHQAGLTAWIPFYWATIEPIYPSQDLFSTKYSDTYQLRIGKRVYANKHLKYKDDYYSTKPSEDFSIQVADAMYINKAYEDSIWYKIAASELNERGHYLYSDLGFYLFYKIIEDLTQVPFSQYTDSVFYSKLGASTMCFNPLNRFTKDEIVPTENDLVFRKQIVHGYVHDPGSAMLGGVCGHAGLFSNANDLAKVMQMYLNEGSYGGDAYLNKRILRKFTDCPSCDEGNRRGMGFDKPQPDTTLPGPSFKGISTKSFGHTGFTGTMAWADPETGIVFIFLSNRVYPDAINFKLVQMDVRTKIQKAIYQAAL
jgi:beta-N-acetylhexosaminidase